ncbi:MAG: sigma-54-dependent Fis family transcriptional regulator [Myxococcales bacterium]|nr:sigma-54-dependent Fis family transcriptional regulator [Myxococcales bacterium]
MSQPETALLAALDEGDLAAAWRATELATPGWAALGRACLGDLPNASRAADEATAEDLGPARLARGLVALGRGDTEGALIELDAAAHANAATVRARAHLVAANALLDRDGPADGSAAVGRLAEARALIDAGLGSLRPSLRLALARARAVTGDVSGAIEDALAVETDARASGHAALRAHSLVVLAELESRRGNELAARRHELAAVEVYEALALTLPPTQRELFWHDPTRRRARLRASSTTDRRTAAQAGLDERILRLFDLTKRLAREHDLDRLLERITDAAVDLTGAERGFVLLPDAEGSLEPRLVRAAGTGPDDPSVAFSRSIAEAVQIDGAPIVTVDARDDRRLSEYLSVHKLMLKSVACVPIRGRSGVAGVLYLEHRVRRGRFAEEDLELLLAFSDQAAVALENAALVSALAQRTRELEASNAELERAKAETERLLTAREGELDEARAELQRTRSELHRRHERRGMIGRSEAMRRVFVVLDRVCESEVPVVIHGESGTGKELIARAIHFGGPRAKGPFVAVNCAAIPEGLLESELFGHVRGAFTGADRDRKGMMERASGGTLFLDEVGDMPMKMQVDLLRVLQDGRVRPVGADDELSVDVRIVAASNKKLEALVASGAFREDLFYRLDVVEIRVPPLRDRHGDVPLLAEHILGQIAEQEGRPRKRLSRDAMLRLESYSWPGNVRQLEHVLLHACVMTPAEVIEAEDLGLDHAGEPRSAPRAPVAAAPAPAEVAQNFDEYKDVEKQRILAALEAHHWNRARAARALGVPRRTFYRRLKEHGIL